MDNNDLSRSIKKLDKKNRSYKSHILNIEDNIIKKDQKLKSLKIIRRSTMNA